MPNSICRRKGAARRLDFEYWKHIDKDRRKRVWVWSFGPSRASEHLDQIHYVAWESSSNSVGRKNCFKTLCRPLTTAQTCIKGTKRWTTVPMPRVDSDFYFIQNKNEICFSNLAQGASSLRIPSEIETIEFRTTSFTSHGNVEGLQGWRPIVFSGNYMVISSSGASKYNLKLLRSRAPYQSFI